MADWYGGPRLRVRLLQEDHEWLALVAGNEDISVYVLASRAMWRFRNWQEKGSKALAEALEIIDGMYCAYQTQLRRQRYVQRKYQRQLRHERNLRRAYERRLRDERNMRRGYEIRLRDERGRRRACETQLQRERDYYERRVRAPAGTAGDVLYDAKVARLLGLAVCSDSDGEARAAFAKARALHRLGALFPA
jgi:hypothetical protein